LPPPLKVYILGYSLILFLARHDVIFQIFPYGKDLRKVFLSVWGVGQRMSQTSFSIPAYLRKKTRNNQKKPENKRCLTGEN